MGCDDHLNHCCSCEHQDLCTRAVPVFSGLLHEDHLRLAGIITSSQYSKGSFVFREGEPIPALFIVRKGLVKLTKTADNGKEHLLRFMFPGDFFGQFALLQDKPCYVNAEVIEPAVICRMDRQQFKPLLEKHPSMAYSFLLAMSERLQQADEWAGVLSTLEVERRLARMLIYAMERSSEQSMVQLPAAKKEVAAMLGTTAETLSRKLTQLETDGVIAVERRNVVILNKQKLLGLAGM